MTCIGLIEFGRTPGAKDKQPRKKRNFLAEGSGLGAVYLGAANRSIKKDLPDAEDVARIARRNAAQAPKDLRAEKSGFDITRSSIRDLETMNQRRPGNNRIKEAIAKRKKDLTSYPGRIKDLENKVAKTAKHAANKERFLRNLKVGKKVTKYGAIGLAGVAGVELARRGINKARQYEIKRR